MQITVGELFDALSIVNIKIFMLEDVKRDSSATDKQIADATRKTNELNSRRNELIQAINEEFGQKSAGQIKLYGK